MEIERFMFFCPCQLSRTFEFCSLEKMQRKYVTNTVDFSASRQALWLIVGNDFLEISFSGPRRLNLSIYEIEINGPRYGDPMR